MRHITAEASQWRAQRRSGKNLVDFAAHPDFDLQPDGSYLSNKLIYSTDTIPVPELEPGTYTLSAWIKSPVGGNYRVRIKYTDGTASSRGLLSTGEYLFSYVVSNPAKTIAEVGFDYGNSSNKVYVREFMLEKGDTATEFEPYCGGAGCLGFSRCKGGYFSTSDEYTLKVVGKTAGVRCVKAETKIIVLGKNLFNKNTVTQGGYLSTSNAVISNASWCYSDCIAVEPNTKYTLRSQTIGIAPATCFYTAGKTFISGVMHNNVNPKVFTTPANAAFARVSVHANSLGNAQFEEGETATPYAAFDANSAALPCDLYDGDVWEPMGGKVELMSIPPTTVTAWINTNNQLAFSPDSFAARFEIEPSTQYELYLDTDVSTLFRAGVTGSAVFPVLGSPLALSSVVRTNTPNRITLNTDASSKYIWVQVAAGQSQAIYNLMAINKATGEVKRMCITTEQYDPQPIFVPQGEVSVLQEPIELMADLSATMLVRR